MSSFLGDMSVTRTYKLASGDDDESNVIIFLSLIGVSFFPPAVCCCLLSRSSDDDDDDDEIDGCFLLFCPTAGWCSSLSLSTAVPWIRLTGLAGDVGYVRV